MCRVVPRLAPAAAAIVASTVIAACGSGSPGNSTSVSNLGHTQAHEDGLSFARCMRSHGVPNFPDPTSGGGFDLNNIAGLSSSSPAFEAAQRACKNLLPVKRPPSGPPSASAYARLLHWAECMRAHGTSGLPDPRSGSPPSPGSPVAGRYGTLMGDGGYWVGIPLSIDAHSPAFARLATACGEAPDGHHG
jgi:hypothetical protein